MFNFHEKKFSFDFFHTFPPIWITVRRQPVSEDFDEYSKSVEMIFCEFWTREIECSKKKDGLSRMRSSSGEV